MRALRWGVPVVTACLVWLVVTSLLDDRIPPGFGAWIAPTVMAILAAMSYSVVAAHGLPVMPALRSWIGGVAAFAFVRGAIFASNGSWTAPAVWLIVVVLLVMLGAVAHEAIELRKELERVRVGGQ